MQRQREEHGNFRELQVSLEGCSEHFRLGEGPRGKYPSGMGMQTKE